MSESEDPEALRPVLERVAQRAPSHLRDVALGLCRAAYRRLPPEQLESLDPDRVAAFLVDAAAFVDQRAPHALSLRVFNPTPEEHGWTAEGTVVEVNADDGPFLLTTVTEELAALGVEIATLLHPIVGVRRTEDGTVDEVHAARHAEHRESWMHLELTERLHDKRLADTERALLAVLADAHLATEDFPPMKERVRAVVAGTRRTAALRYGEEEISETVAFLEWLLDDHFVLLGYREYDFIDTDGEGRAVVAQDGSGLGILQDTSTSKYAEPTPMSSVPEGLRKRMEGGPLLLVSRTNRQSTVHRRERMIYIGVKKVSQDGRLAGECRFLGLFAQKAYAERASAIPVLRRKLASILEAEDFVDHSHDERTIRGLFESFPKQELFAADTDELRSSLVQLLETQKRQDVRLLCRLDAHGRSATALVALPRERFNPGIRRRIQDLLTRRFEAASVDYHLSLTEREQALLHFVLHADPQAGGIGHPALGELEGEITALTRTWEDEFADELRRRHGARESAHLAVRWTARLAPAFREAVTPGEAVDDVAELDQLTDEAPVRMRVVRRRGGEPGMLRFKLYRLGAAVELSGFLPILESLGLVGVEEVPHVLEPAREGGGRIHVHDFGVRPRVSAPQPLELDRDGPRLADAAMAMWRGQAEADSLNRLVLLARLAWDEVIVLRAYRRYRRQVGTAFTESYQNDALCRHPDIARALMGVFEARFDPDRDAGQVDVDEARQVLLELLEGLERLDEDRILRGYLAMIDATLRTNRYRVPTRPWLAFKLDTSQLPDVPKPVPYAEIFIYSPTFEGVHLRGGPVARGGLRWSDRVEDFRTEVLGLMKAQMVKNAVIVPTGAKGGFVLKQPPAGGEELRAEVRRRYSSYVRGLLDVTDNIVGGVVTPPDRVRRMDGDDPYMVVAADRGTATFSDVANAISAEYDYWLGDAFASGGSSGYDHKAMGITARGAWVAVQRHFRELDIDVQREPIAVVGIGDMSGDVFGNGMLQSRALKLLAAFDHRDIFIDPDPDPEASFAERSRLYHLPGSSWQDYDRDVLSPGGGVWPRSVKEIALSEQARKALRVDAERISPPDLMRAILSAPADLLFAGGVGTFVKASTESHADVGDRANDAVRVDANRAGARVIGEGGNLAVTQRGRIQYARRGGRINLDAIDNSAGVDTSDREVNLKILLQQAVEAGRLDPGERDEVLGEVADDVADRVLGDVYLQTWAISQELAYSPGGMEGYEQLMVDLEQAGRLDREVEGLPPTAEMNRRRDAGAGLTRPEVAVLLGYAKVDLRTRLLDSPMVGEPALRRELERYFPARVASRFDDLLDEHRLRGELIVTMVANDIVNRMGVTYVSRTAHELGSMAFELAGCYWIAREVADADSLWHQVGALDGQVEPSVQLELKVEVDRLVDAFVRAYVRQGAHDDLAGAVDRDRSAFTVLEKSMMSVEQDRRQRTRRERAERFTGAGVPQDVADRFAGLAELVFAPDVAEVSRSAGQPVEHVGAVFDQLSVTLPVDRLQQRLQVVEPAGHWERWQHRGLTDELRQLRRIGASRAIAEHPEVPADEAVRRFLDARAPATERAGKLGRMLDGEGEPDLAAVAVVTRALRQIVS